MNIWILRVSCTVWPNSDRRKPEALLCCVRLCTIPPSKHKALKQCCFNVLCLRRWLNIETTLVQSLVFTGHSQRCTLQTLEQCITLMTSIRSRRPDSDRNTSNVRMVQPEFEPGPSRIRVQYRVEPYQPSVMLVG